MLESWYFFFGNQFANPISIQSIPLTRLIDFDTPILTFTIANKRGKMKEKLIVNPLFNCKIDKSVLTLEMLSRRFPFLPYGLSRLNHQLCDLFRIV